MQRRATPLGSQLCMRAYTTQHCERKSWLCRRTKPERLALFYMLAGQEGSASAVPLSRDSRGFHSMTLRPGANSGTYRVSVAYDVAVQRHVETTVTLHSGIQVTSVQSLYLNFLLGIYVATLINCLRLPSHVV